jgi:hypothetical protein
MDQLLHIFREEGWSKIYLEYHGPMASIQSSLPEMELQIYMCLNTEVDIPILLKVLAIGICADG